MKEFRRSTVGSIVVINLTSVERKARAIAYNVFVAESERIRRDAEIKNALSILSVRKR